ncbi:MAG TPA: tRNA 2-thiouridine(34) synthase MnmA [Solirubrobacterales bacterium]
MDADLFQAYLADGGRRGEAPAEAHSGAAGGAPCGDLVRVSLVLDSGRADAVRFDAEGCAAARAAGAAVAELAEGAGVLEAAAIGSGDVAAALGGLSVQGRHAADLAADALHRALTAAVRAGAAVAEPASGRVLVAMSGGVDSAVAALLEREAGNEVVAVTLKLWADRRTDGEKSCCSPQAVLGARALAHSLGIPHFTMDLESEFRSAVVGEFLAGYAAGRTPNPCVRCNGELRIDAMAELADRLGAVGLATGHYARVADDGEGPLLTAAADPAKDQTYMLAALAPATLAKLRFPLADIEKPRVRELAAEAGLPVANKRESQDLCFLAGEGRRSFLRRHGRLRDREGDLVDRRGRVLGRHRGHHHFTVGQRRGIGVAATEPLYVLATDATSNRVTIGTREELAVGTIALRDVVLNRDASRVDTARVRYHSKPLACRVVAHAPDGTAQLDLAEPATGVAPGQTAALMDGDMIIGHATIARPATRGV